MGEGSTHLTRNRSGLQANRVAFGMYELLDRIAVGGMAEIYLAREAGALSDEDYIVVKRILPHFAADRQLVEMFLDEQRVAATLMHPNIVRTYDVGEVNGEFFISMEYMHGEDVRRIFRTLKKRRMLMPLELSLTIIAGAARGLHYAHEKKGVSLQPLNIVHRDVTPHNIFVTYDGEVKVLDFGVAKAANRMIQTASGTIKGKIPYMSPEQCKGRALDRRTDIYALGVILYELTCGVRLYHATGVEFETMRRIVEEPAMPPTMRRPDYPRELERIVLKALEKRPQDRHQTAKQLADELEQFADKHALSLSIERLSAFMNELFQNDIAAWRQAGGDITKLIDQIVAKQSEEREENEIPSGSGEAEVVASLEPAHSLRRLQSADEPAAVAGARHIGNALTGTLQSVWGAASSTNSMPSAAPRDIVETSEVSSRYQRLSQSLAAVSLATADEDHALAEPGEDPAPSGSGQGQARGQASRQNEPGRVLAGVKRAAAPAELPGPGLDSGGVASKPEAEPEDASPPGSRVIAVHTSSGRRTVQRPATRPRPSAMHQAARAQATQHAGARPTWQWILLIVLGMGIAFCIGIAL